MELQLWTTANLSMPPFKIYADFTYLILFSAISDGPPTQFEFVPSLSSRHVMFFVSSMHFLNLDPSFTHS